MTTRIAVTTPDGELPALTWTPPSGSGPGLLLLQEIFGVTGYIRRRAADLAAAACWQLPQDKTRGRYRHAGFQGAIRGRAGARPGGFDQRL